MIPDGDFPSHRYNVLCAMMGQFLAHDVSSGVMFTVGNGSTISCCTKSGGCLPPDQLHMACAPIAVPHNDPFYAHFNRTCMSFVRVQLAPSPDCRCGYAKQLMTLTLLHTMFTREHNRIVSELLRYNPDCDEDALFNTAKRILIAMYQHIMFDEWLPLIIGCERMRTFNLASGDGYSTCYDPDVNPSTLAEFTSAAIRVLHSAIAGNIWLVKNDYVDQMMYGMSAQPMQCIDPFITVGMTCLMFRRGLPYGNDIVAMDIQRGRKRLAKVYRCPEDVDLWVGALLEAPVKGGIVGPVYANIIAEQFSRYKCGDPYHFNHGPDVNPGAFTPCKLID
ncbi:Peroxinectin-like [Operophtera brumata]|uniref:Peroxinectin-like n=1 Tax=Operophtera brumata TaxID=104452 RepID=A0A0L7LUH1_OPEBR|nr:Peroxinectin-like [Operophtera brumata]